MQILHSIGLLLQEQSKMKLTYQKERTLHPIYIKIRWCKANNSEHFPYN